MVLTVSPAYIRNAHGAAACAISAAHRESCLIIIYAARKGLWSGVRTRINLHYMYIYRQKSDGTHMELLLRVAEREKAEESSFTHSLGIFNLAIKISAS